MKDIYILSINSYTIFYYTYISILIETQFNYCQVPTDKSHCVTEQAGLLKFAQCDLSNAEIYNF